MQNNCNLIGSNKVHISDIFNCKVQVSMETKTPEGQTEYTKHLSLY